MGLKMYDNSSIGTSNKARPKEVLEGINKAIIWNLCFWIHIILMPIKIEKDKVKVTIRWLVTVKLYGINPIKLLNSTKVKTTEIKGKYFSPFLLILSNSNWDDVSYKVSINTCHAFGIKKKQTIGVEQFLFELKKNTNKIKNIKTKIFTNTKLVIEKSKQNSLIENNKIIWNCSNGVCNISF